jgi:hypothetical protein
MVNTRHQDSHHDRNEESSWSSASKLSRKVRELAHRSYHALHPSAGVGSATHAGQADIAEDLQDLCDQVARLQEKIHSRGLGALIPWVDALRRQVEDGLGHAPRGGTR